MQLDLFEHVFGAYGQPASGRLSNDELYRVAVGRAGLDRTELAKTSPVGRDAQPRSLLKRRIRWHQQTLRHMGILHKVDGSRGIWELTELGRSRLRAIKDGAAVVACSTDLGVAIWANCSTVFARWNEPIFLALTSPPYPLRTPRAYGNPPVGDYVDFVCSTLEPIVRNLVPGGNVALSLGDVFEPGLAAKSTYIEELTLALRQRLGLFLMNRIVWASNKPPGPVQWASKKRVQLNEGYEFVLWFCNDPGQCIADNRRVLEPHAPAHLRLMASGGERGSRRSGDGAYRIREGSFANVTAGRIPRNVFSIANQCASQRAYKRRAIELGLQTHGAPMPLSLARKLVRFLSDVDQLVVDPFAGSLTTAVACELEGRRWVATERVYDYVRGGAERFAAADGFDLSL